jgi:glycosyltransferase involved in cell wall biosynthesis
LGGFDETFRPAYYEETDYCARLWDAGLRVVYEPAAVLLHYEFASSSSSAHATSLQAEHQQIFARRHAAALKEHFDPDPDSILPARTRGNSRRILFIDDRVPHPWLGSGFPRARTMLLALRKYGFFVTLYPMAVIDEAWTSVYSDLPRDVEVMNELGPTLLEAFLRNRRGYYEAIVVSRPHNMKYLRPVVDAHPDWFENVTVVYDAEALFAPRDIGLLKLNGNHLTDEAIRNIYHEEISLAAPADYVIAVSEGDRNEFRRYGIERVSVLGHSLDPAPTPAQFGERAGFLFIGAVYDGTSPNGDSLIWFLSEIWPLIRQKLANASLTIAGINRSQRVRDLAGTGVHILGQVADLTGLYNCVRVFIAPTRFAAGIPHKVHEAAARGVPVVATSVLARQLGWSDGNQLQIADDPAEFAEKCVELHQRAELWSRLRDLALAAIGKECSRFAFEAKIQEIMKEIPMRTAQRYADARMDR